MSVPTFQSIVASSHFYSYIAQSKDAAFLYDSLLSTSQARIAMYDAICADRPAIYPVIRDIEHYYDNQTHCDFDLNNDQVKQAFGRLVAELVRPFGFVPKKTKSKGSFGKEFKYFKTGKKYELLEDAEEIVEKVIVPTAIHRSEQRKG